jgi:hypothetical protein
MKKMFFCLIVFFGLMIPLFSYELISFNFTDIESNNKFNENRLSYKIDYLPIINYSKILTPDESIKVVKNIEFSNMILGIIALTGYTANTIIGPFILAEKFQNLPYDNGLLYSHIPVGLISGLLDATVISLGYADLGLRKKYKMGYNKAYAISIYINTAFAIAEVGLVIANVITSRFNPEAAKWIGVAHAVTTAATLVSLGVQFGLSFSINIPEKT